MGERAVGAQRWALAFIGVVLFAGLIFALPAGRRPFLSSDEARFALLARDIVERGRWLVPHIRGEPYLNKPQLYFWSIALVSVPGGRVTEVTAAIPSVLSAAATVAAVIAIGRQAWSWPTGLLAGLILATTLPYAVLAHEVLSDVMMTAWMTWSAYFLLVVMGGDPRRGAVVSFYVCIGGAVLSKGPAGLAALAAAIVAVVFARGWHDLERLRPALGLTVLVAMSLLWVVPYVVESHDRFTRDVVGGHYGTWYFRGEILPRVGHFLLIPVNFLPWTIVLAGAAVWWRRTPDLPRRLIGLWALTLAILMTLPGEQRSRYLMPVYPGLALLTAEFLTRGRDRSGMRPLRVTMVAFAFTMAAVAIAATSSTARDAVHANARTILPDGPLELALLTACLFAVAVVATATVWRGAYAVGATVMAVVLGVAILVVGIDYPARYARANDIRPLAATALARAGPDGVILGYPDLWVSWDFYLGRPAAEATRPDEVVRALNADARGVVITSRERWAALAPTLGPQWQVLSAGTVRGREIVVVGRTSL